MTLLADLVLGAIVLAMLWLTARVRPARGVRRTEGER